MYLKLELSVTEKEDTLCSLGIIFRHSLHSTAHESCALVISVTKFNILKQDHLGIITQKKKKYIKFKLRQRWNDPGNQVSFLITL